jgi:hypothetical protein
VAPSFVCTETGTKAALTENYPQRWHLEEFFNLNQALDGSAPER